MSDIPTAKLTQDAALEVTCASPYRERHVPRYFFNRVDGTRDQDRDGLELPSLDHARYEAVAFAADTLKDDSFSLWDGGEVRIEVVDIEQTLLFTIVISAINEAPMQNPQVVAER